MNNPLSNPTIGGTELKLPVYSTLSTATGNLTDGKFELGDITAPVDVTMSILTTAMDPVHALVGAGVDFLLNYLMSHISFLKDAVDSLLGNPDAILAHAHTWETNATKIAAVGNQHADTVTQSSQWTGPAAEAYQQTQRKINELFREAADSASAMGKWISAAGSVVAVAREFLWGMIKDFITQVVESAILAIAAMIPSAGFSITAFGSWFVARLAIIGGKVTKTLSKLFKTLATFSRKCGMGGQHFDSAAQNLAKAAQNLGRSAGRSLSKSGMDLKPKMPGKTEDDGVKKAKDLYDKGRKTVTGIDKGLKNGTIQDGQDHHVRSI